MTSGTSVPPCPGDGEGGRPCRTELDRALEAFQQGVEREASFEVIFRHYRPKIERFLARRVFSPEERLDLTQEVFLRIYRGLEGYRGDGTFEAWVIQIAFNVYRKWRDRQPGGRYAVPAVPLDARPAPEAVSAAGFPTTAAPASPFDHVVLQERQEALREAIEELPRRQRHCLELRVYQERSLKEIAAALRISPETVKVHLFQARNRLLERLRGTLGPIEL